MDYMTPTTTLEAVNLMLSVIGEAPVNSLVNSGLADANLALQILSYASRETQIRGWHWNTEEDFPITLNQNNELVLPTNTLKVDTAGANADLDLIQRGTRLYDRKAHTFTFDGLQGGQVLVEIVLLLAFDELPEAGRNYITIRAARQFQNRINGADPSQAYTARDEMTAFIILQEAETETGDYNMLTDSYAVGRILARTSGNSI